MLSSTQPGERLLAEQFGVEPWSTEFVKIIACIFERADLVGKIVLESQLEVGTKIEAVENLREFKLGFASNSLAKSWNSHRNGLNRMKENGKNLGFLQDTVRRRVCYPKLSSEEIEEIIGLIDSYLSELAESEISPPFVRQAIVDGLHAFRFQLQYIGWMGAGYTLTAFRELIFLYEAANRRFENDGNPDAEAALRGLMGIIKAVKERIDTVRGYNEAASYMLGLYKGISSAATPFLLLAHFTK